MRSAMFPWKRSLRLQLMATYVVAMLLTGLGVAAVLAAILTWDMDGVARRGLTVVTPLSARGRQARRESSPPTRR